MKTLKKVTLEIIEVEYIPEVKDMMFGTLYYAPHWNMSNHLCPCGCGNQTPLPIKEGEWSLSVSEGKPTITPSIQHRYNCLSHYVITNGVANMLNHPRPKENWLDQYGHDTQPGE